MKFILQHVVIYQEQKIESISGHSAIAIVLWLRLKRFTIRWMAVFIVASHITKSRDDRQEKWWLVCIQWKKIQSSLLYSIFRWILMCRVRDYVSPVFDLVSLLIHFRSKGRRLGVATQEPGK